MHDGKSWSMVVDGTLEVLIARIVCCPVMDGNVMGLHRRENHLAIGTQRVRAVGRLWGRNGLLSVSRSHVLSTAHSPRDPTVAVQVNTAVSH